MANWTHITEATPGLPNAGRLSGTDGDLVGILDVALPLQGWAIEYSSGNARIYRPSVGNRMRLYVNDAAAASGDARAALVRGCENASAASNAGLIDPFPLSTQVSDSLCNWQKSTTVGTTARLFDIVVGDTFIFFLNEAAGTTNRWNIEFFGDCPPFLLGDAYNTLITTRNSTPAGSTPVWDDRWTTSVGLFPGSIGACAMFWARSYDGTVKSSVGTGAIAYGNGIGSLSSTTPPALLGPSTGIDTTKFPLRCAGSVNTTPSNSIGSPIRGWMPNFLAPQHGGRGALNSRDVYTNSAIAGFLGLIMCADNSTASPFGVVQLDDGWTKPNG